MRGNKGVLHNYNINVVCGIKNTCTGNSEGCIMYNILNY